MTKLIFKFTAFTFLSVMIVLQWKRGYFRNFPDYLRKVRRSKAVSARSLLLFAALTALVMCVDPGLLNAVQAIKNSVLGTAILFGGWLGRGANLWLVLICLYLSSAAFLRTAASDRIFGALFSMSLASIACSIFKRVLLRARPYAEMGHLSFMNISGLTHNRNLFQSFPSGDVVIVAAAAFYFFYLLRNPFLRWFVFLFPLLTALSRISLNRHWPSDTLFACGLALAAARFVFAYEMHTAPVRVAGTEKSF